jgi:hypothetical protein
MGQQNLDFSKISGSCSNLTSLATSLNSTTANIQSSVKKVKSPAWEGKAATNFRTQLTKLIDNLPVADRQLALASVFLANCAGNYKALGEESVNKIKELLGGQEAIDKFDVNSVKDVLSYYNMNDLQDTTTTQPTKDTPTYTNPTYTSPTYTRSTPTYSTTPTYSSTISPTLIITAAPTIGTVTGLVTTALAGKTIEIPSSIQQGAYTVTGYDYWINSGKPMTWKEGTNQRKVSEIWKAQGSRFKNGIAVITVDGEDRYLVAVSPKFGLSGDCIDVTLENGQVIKCIIGDSKGQDAGSEWGHVLGGGKINVLEFEVQREKYLASGNPTTEKWGLEWDSSCPVKSISNKGSIIGAQLTEKTVLTGNTQVEGNVIKTSAPVTSGTQYNISDSDLAYLAHVAKREQGSVEGAKLELSLMANLYEKNKGKYKDVVDYVKNSGWFSKRSTNSYTDPGADYVNAAKEVISGGNRYLPTNVVEHDCLSDITSISTGSVNDRSNYIPGETIIKNKYGATYKFVGFAPNGGDPFGYLV